MLPKKDSQCGSEEEYFLALVNFSSINMPKFYLHKIWWDCRLYSEAYRIKKLVTIQDELVGTLPPLNLSLS
jgi:hypothetical protein